MTLLGVTFYAVQSVRTGEGLITNSESPVCGKTIPLKTPGICEN